MSGITQAQALAVLRDLVELHGRVDDEVRVELARMLRGLRIATRWSSERRFEVASHKLLAETWERFEGGGYRSRVIPDAVDSYSPDFATRDEARAWADERLRAAGWALAPEEGA